VGALQVAHTRYKSRVTRRFRDQFVIEESRGRSPSRGPTSTTWRASRCTTSTSRVW